MGACDGCSQFRKTRRVELGGGSGVNLCDSCLKKEIRWRKAKNAALRRQYAKYGQKPPKSVLFRTKYKF